MYELEFKKNTKRFTEEELLNNIGKLWDILKRQPTTKDLSMEESCATMGTYFNRFGSWKNAVEEFVKYKNNGTLKIKDSKKIRKSKRKTISASVRYKIMKRDNFKCVLCGDSPAINNSTTLEIDHITPLSKGGTNSDENLRTLCKRCNIGKFDK